MFNSLEELLSLKDRSILFVGIGNVLKSDDGTGVYISSNIRNRDNISALTVEVSIENYIGKINSIDPGILVLVDCVDLQSPPGTYKLLDINEIQDITHNTHNISLRRVADFFKMPVFILAIQPEKVDFGENISYLVKDIADRIINQINT